MPTRTDSEEEDKMEAFDECLAEVLAKYHTQWRDGVCRVVSDLETEIAVVNNRPPLPDVPLLVGGNLHFTVLELMPRVQLTDY